MVSGVCLRKSTSWAIKQPAALMRPARGAGQTRIPLTINSVPAVAYFRAFEFRQHFIALCRAVWSLFVFLSFSHFKFFLTDLCHVSNIDNIDHEHAFSASSLGLQGSTFMGSFVARTSNCCDHTAIPYACASIQTVNTCPCTAHLISRLLFVIRARSMAS